MTCRSRTSSHQRRLHLQRQGRKFVKVNSMNYARWYPTLAEMATAWTWPCPGSTTSARSHEQRVVQPFDQHLDRGAVPRLPDLPGHLLTESGQLFFTGSNSGYGRPPPRGGLPASGTSTPTCSPRCRASRTRRPGDQRLGPAASRAEADLHGPGRRRCRQSNLSTARTALIDTSAPNRTGPGPEPGRATRYPITVLLPNDEVLVTGGSKYYRGMHAATTGHRSTTWPRIRSPGPRTRSLAATITRRHPAPNGAC